MNILAELQNRFRTALSPLVDDAAQLDALVDMVRSSSDAKFGDYQVNCAMPLGKRLSRSPREVAAEIIERLDVAEMCHPAEVAGPGFINIKIRDDWLLRHLTGALRDEQRLGVLPVGQPRSYIVDYSGPNVAKPMHVGHIRSTVIGDALLRILRFKGHRVVGDNHIGDWGTQFGMIIFGWKNFRDEAAYAKSPVAELARLYRLVSQLSDYQKTKQKLPELQAKLKEARRTLDEWSQAPQKEDKAAAKKAAKALRRQQMVITETGKTIAELQNKIAVVEGDAALSSLASRHADISAAALDETARLHSGDEENLRLWHQFLPPCIEDIESIYRRLGVTFDETLGESFYHDRLAGVVETLRAKDLVTESDGAACVFLDGFDYPMIVQKSDGAFLYATTDLATIEYRIETWQSDVILYVVDHRQSDHFAQLFAVAKLCGLIDLELAHVSFGTVLGDDGRPFKTRSGETVGLGGLLDEAERRALEIVSENDDRKPQSELSPQDRREVARKVGIGAIKYADLAHARTSDYVFSYDKMLATRGNTATYMQYAYARVRSIFRKGGIDIDALRQSPEVTIELAHPAERALALGLLGISEAIDSTLHDYRPNQMTAYLFDLASRYSTFYQECEVLKAEDQSIRTSRLLLCDLTARTLKLGLELLGIDVNERM